MTAALYDTRALAKRVAALLRDKGRSAGGRARALRVGGVGAERRRRWARALLAEALRIEPKSEVAKMAFERMEGLAGDHAELEQCSSPATRPTSSARLDREGPPPPSQRAQVGFNNNLLGTRASIYHVQTEDSGLNKPHVPITSTSSPTAGASIKSHKRSLRRGRRAAPTW